MKSSSLLASVARITGDTLATVDRLGFRLNQGVHAEKPAPDDPLAVIDCPCCGGTVVVAWNRTDELHEFADCRRCETVFPYSEREIYEIDLLEIAVPKPLAYAPAA